MNAHKRKKIARIEAYKMLNEVKAEQPQQEKLVVEVKKEVAVAEPIQEQIVQVEEVKEITQESTEVEPTKNFKKKKSS